MRPICIGVAAAAAALMSPVRAVIVQGGDGTQNTTGAAAGIGWNYVGGLNGASAVYLGSVGGNQWVLSAAHVGTGTFSLGGFNYALVPGSAVSLTNPDLGASDLRLFRIHGDPGLEALAFASLSPAAGTPVTMIGNGFDREANETFWTAGWNETSNPILGTNKGYKWLGTKTKRWGTQTVSSAAAMTVVSGVSTQAFRTTFARTTGSAQAAPGDSGGGVFLADGSLAGIMIAISGFTGQPAATAIYGNQTIIADIAFYAPQIGSIMAAATIPEPSALALGALAFFALAVARQINGRAAMALAAGRSPTLKNGRDKGPYLDGLTRMRSTDRGLTAAANSTKNGLEVFADRPVFGEAAESALDEAVDVAVRKPGFSSLPQPLG